MPHWICNKRHWFFYSAFFIFIGCASYQSQVSKARNFVEEGRFTEAELELQTKINEAKDDKLAYLLEYSLVLHQAGKYKESNKILKEAEELADKNDYISVSREFGSILLNEGMVQFKVETFEYLLINIYRALNYMMLGDYENAQVMARRINDKLKQLEVDGDSRKRQNAFAYYLAAMMWESQGDADNAQILYAKAHGLMPELEILRRDWYICAQRAQRPDIIKKISKMYPGLKKKYDWSKLRKEGELIVIFQQGWAPRKRPRPENHRFPTVVPVRSYYDNVEVIVDGGKSLIGEKVYDLDIIAKQTLDADFGRLLAKKAAGIAAKATLAHQVNKKHKGLGDLLFLAMDAADRADLRQWSMLPSSFELVLIYLKPGKHKVKINAIGRGSSSILFEEEVTIQRGKKRFITKRAF